ncbi:hypothetical protein SAMN05444156_1076 [Verrucomicrobium sp. GAS474]|uniref:hypothetical protein n=1 Tax=Verrucomicrobium sp. GAS474 TaxID=1882831 RepID=UPI00087BAAAA|nr:hypothetical protein [Verrucomicrobium sp. GAS474]SDT95997.1 hypothetical protein SAMN05444156_1076 [Verrucomicrobium sp. GAS474]
MISAITTRTSETQAAFASNNIEFQQSISSQRAKESNQIPTRIAEVQKSSATQTATSTDTILSANQTAEVSDLIATSSVSSPEQTVETASQSGSNLATDQAPTSDSLIGASTYNSQGQIHAVHSGTGHIFSAAA